MSRSVFGGGSNLPPGCTLGDIDRAAGFDSQMEAAENWALEELAKACQTPDDYKRAVVAGLAELTKRPPSNIHETVMCYHCESHPALPDDELCAQCRDNASEAAWERAQEEGPRGGEAGAQSAEEQARIQRELK